MSLNIGLEEVSEATGISAGVLKALEIGDREKFPAEVYVKAFYKKYAQYLGLNPEEILSAYQPQSNLQKKAKSRYNLGTGITLKDQDESIFSEIAGWLYVPIIVILGGVILYWIYVNYLAPY
ncbi:MAG: helix-turn-helix domain-containing protein [Deltaproteobacteria bacterium]|jgi:cytoskeletal protein RodZ|nr:helix-turn-helix domain-containing protein [Deltaproteobacteria bacterium]